MRADNRASGASLRTRHVLLATILTVTTGTVLPAWATGVIDTVVGGANGDGLSATVAKIAPGGMDWDTAGNLYIADRVNSRIRRVDVAGTVSTVAGELMALCGCGPADARDGGPPAPGCRARRTNPWWKQAFPGSFFGFYLPRRNGNDRAGAGLPRRCRCPACAADRRFRDRRYDPRPARKRCARSRRRPWCGPGIARWWTRT